MKVFKAVIATLAIMGAVMFTTGCASDCCGKCSSEAKK